MAPQSVGLQLLTTLNNSLLFLSFLSLLYITLLYSFLLTLSSVIFVSHFLPIFSSLTDFISTSFLPLLLSFLHQSSHSYFPSFSPIHFPLPETPWPQLPGVFSRSQQGPVTRHHISHSLRRSQCLWTIPHLELCQKQLGHLLGEVGVAIGSSALCCSSRYQSHYLSVTYRYGGGSFSFSRLIKYVTQGFTTELELKEVNLLYFVYYTLSLLKLGSDFCFILIMF